MTLAEHSGEHQGSAAEAFLAEVHEHAQAAAYPALFEPSLSPPGAIVSHAKRRASGLRTLVLRHGRLGEAQRQALTRFRLDQFLLCEWYDPARIRACRAEGDPAFDSLPDETLHVCVGTDAAKLLAYACLTPVLSRDASDDVCLGTPGRPLLQPEAELYGQPVFGMLPAVAEVPLRHVMEIACIVRNQASSSPVTSVAVVEMLLAATRVLTDPAHQVRVTLGQADANARKLLWQLGYPMLYAPRVPVMPLSHDFYWRDDVNAQGRFWPFAVATKDLCSSAHERAQLEHMIALPPREARRALARVLRAFLPTPPTTLLHQLERAPFLWTSDPLSIPYMVEAAPVA